MMTLDDSMIKNHAKSLLIFKPVFTHNTVYKTNDSNS